MSDPEVQALTIMKYLAKFQKLTEQDEKPHIRILDANNVQANKPVSSETLTRTTVLRCSHSRENSFEFLKSKYGTSAKKNPQVTFEIVGVNSMVNIETDLSVEVMLLKNFTRVPVR